MASRKRPRPEDPGARPWQPGDGCFPPPGAEKFQGPPVGTEGMPQGDPFRDFDPKCAGCNRSLYEPPMALGAAPSTLPMWSAAAGAAIGAVLGYVIADDPSFLQGQIRAWKQVIDSGALKAIVDESSGRPVRAKHVGKPVKRKSKPKRSKQSENVQ
jgi:hypothetical protein